MGFHGQRMARAPPVNEVTMVPGRSNTVSHEMHRLPSQMTTVPVWPCMPDSPASMTRSPPARVATHAQKSSCEISKLGRYWTVGRKSPSSPRQGMSVRGRALVMTNPRGPKNHGDEELETQSTRSASPMMPPRSSSMRGGTWIPSNSARSRASEYSAGVMPWLACR